MLKRIQVIVAVMVGVVGLNAGIAGASNTVGLVEDIWVQNGLLFFQIENQLLGALCEGDTDPWFVVSFDDPSAKSMNALLLTARLSGSRVRVRGNDRCHADWDNSEFAVSVSFWD